MAGARDRGRRMMVLAALARKPAVGLAVAILLHGIRR